MPTEHTRARLARGLEALLEHQPLRSISVSDIAQQCGLTRQGFYRYFHTRDDLIRWMYRRDFAAAFAGEEAVEWDAMVLKMLETLRRKRGLYRRMVRQADDATLYHIMLDYTDVLYSRIIRWRTGRPLDEEMKFLLRMYGSGGIEMATEWVRGGMARPAGELKDLFLAGMPPKLAGVLTGFAVPIACVIVPEDGAEK